MLDSKTYIKANKNVCAINCIRKLIQDNIPFSETLEDYAEYLHSYLPFVDAKEMQKEVIATLERCRNVPGLVNVISSDRKKFVAPMYKTTLSYIEDFIGQYTVTEVSCMVDNGLLAIGR